MNEEDQIPRPLPSVGNLNSQRFGISPMNANPRFDLESPNNQYYRNTFSISPHSVFRPPNGQLIPELHEVKQENLDMN